MQDLCLSQNLWGFLKFPGVVLYPCGSVLPLCWTRSDLVCLKLIDKKGRQMERGVIGLCSFTLLCLQTDWWYFFYSNEASVQELSVLDFMSFNHFLPLFSYLHWAWYANEKIGAAGRIILLVRTWWCFNSFQVICCWCENSTSKWMVTASPYVLCINFCTYEGFNTCIWTYFLWWCSFW